MSDENPEKPGKTDLFEAAVKELAEQGTDHRLFIPTLKGAGIGAILGFITLDGSSGLLLGAMFGVVIAILLNLED